MLVRVHAYIMGEHGDSEFAVWSHANIAGVNLEEFLKDTQNVQEAELIELFEGVRDAAYTIINKKRCNILRYRSSPCSYY